MPPGIMLHFSDYFPPRVPRLIFPFVLEPLARRRPGVASSRLLGNFLASLGKFLFALEINYSSFEDNHVE